MTYEEFLDEVKILNYACPFGLILNTDKTDEKSGSWYYEGVNGDIASNKLKIDKIIPSYKIFDKNE